MRLYNVVLFVHMLGFIALFGAFAWYQRSGVRLRRARGLSEVRAWLGVLEATRGMFDGGAAMLLVTGMIMAAMRWRGLFPWIAVAMAGLLGIWIVTSILGRRRGRALEAAATAAGPPDSPVPPELSRLIHQQEHWIVMAVPNGIALGIVWLMTNKPEWIESVAVVAGLGVLAAVTASIALHRPRAAQ